MMFNIHEILAEEIAKAHAPPAKRWVCEYETLIDHQIRCHDCKGLYFNQKGSKFRSHCKTRPSKDVAETVGMAFEKKAEEKFREAGHPKPVKFIRAIPLDD